MTLEQQVVSLELAKKLKELGVKQQSYFSWYWIGLSDLKYAVATAEDVKHPTAAAFTVAELGEMLPLRIDARSKKDGRKRISYFLEYESGGLVARYAHHLDIRQILCEASLNTEADARAKMLIYLIEHDFLIPKAETQSSKEA